MEHPLLRDDYATLWEFRQAHAFPRLRNASRITD